ncbi:MAG TPA: NADH-quinone oxidoreductase subunit N [Miltoncostaeaceae bacterium]|nr:NADH-quinone oxidoreductase subunit N [Miltoncostaeaceae bacterium]
MSALNVYATTPLLIVSGTAVLATSVGLVKPGPVRRHGPTIFGLAGIVAAIVMSLVLWGARVEASNGGLRGARFALIFNIIFLGCAAATLLIGWRDPAAVDRRGEYVSLILVATAGMMLVAGAGDLISVFLGIEVLSVALYVLAALEVWRSRSLEAGLKYLITGAVGAALLLYGLTFLFGATGSTSLSAIGDRLAGSSLLDEPFLLAAFVLICAGLAFKASAAPFHMWAPDVYEGSPTSISGFMATATKAAAFAALLRLFTGLIPDMNVDWRVMIAAVAVASIVVGNLAALVQENLKRMLAYSSIAQAGYLLIGVAAGTVQGTEGVIYFLMAYAVATMAAFVIVAIREREVEDGERISAFSGYGHARPWMGTVLTLSMLSLAGFPPLSGFIGKLLVFGSAVDVDMIWLAAVGALGSIVSLGYYLRVIAVTWFGARDEDRLGRTLPVTGAAGIIAVSLGAGIIALALFAGPLLSVCQSAAEALIAP